MARDIYREVTDTILAQLEKGVRPWQRPWETGVEAEKPAPTLPLRHNGEPYRGTNVVLLWSAASERGYDKPTWMTYRQAQELGGNVRKGEKGVLVTFARTWTKKEVDPETGIEEEKEVPVMKGYTVFNVAQIDGLPQRYYERKSEETSAAARIEGAEAWLQATGVELRHGGDKAYHSPAGDYRPAAVLRGVQGASRLLRDGDARDYPLDAAPGSSGPEFRAEALRRQRLRDGGADGRAGFRLRRRRDRDRAGGARGSRGLHRRVDGGDEGRQEGLLHGGVARREGGRIPERTDRGIPADGNARGKSGRDAPSTNEDARRARADASGAGRVVPAKPHKAASPNDVAIRRRHSAITDNPPGDSGRAVEVPFGRGRLSGNLGGNALTGLPVSSLPAAHREKPVCLSGTGRSTIAHGMRLTK